MTENQKAFLEALDKTLGIVSHAAKKCNLSREAHYEWMRESEEYKQAVEAVQLSKCDFVESSLMKLVKEQNPAAVIFASKTLLRHRGYGEVVEHRGQGTAGEIVFRLDYGNTDADPSGH